ncbi:MAG: SUMF1/EgtB/PvdO family nonheme iron enzyme [Alphaproteobacteria bacterium]|nr:SUMF1/EgtB/PvdO family nonheme iron enzyme [Alphaproteobacteria bacterium]
MWASPAQRLCAGALVALVCLAAGAAAAQGIRLGASSTPHGRVALVVGNSAYRDMPLRNSANDARAMAAKLRALGFDVVHQENLARAQIGAAVAEFVAKIKPDSTALFYYAGHGMQSNQRNYLIPTDAEVPSEAALPFVGIDAAQLAEQMDRAGARVKFVILDACRNNPFERRLRGGTGRGLAKMDAARGSMIAFATAPGSVAADGDGEHGVYTEALLDALSVPGLKAEEVFKRAREQVIEATREQQTPWEQSSLVGDFVFNLGGEPARPAPAAQADREALFWHSIQASGNASDFAAYLKRYPQGEFAPLAQNRLAALGARPLESAPFDKSSGGSTAAGSAAAGTAPGDAERGPPRGERTLEPFDKDLVARTAARVREAPDLKARQVATLREGESARVLARVKGENWYQVALKDQVPGFVAASLLEEPEAYRRRRTEERKDEPAAPARAEVAMLGPAAPDAGAPFRDCEVCPELVMVPAGSFTMGASLADRIETKESNETPPRLVTIAKSFALGRFEVTWAQFRACIDERACCLGGTRCKALSDEGWGAAIQDDKRPAAGVSWEDAQDYVAWLSRRTGRRYRLPSEAEWEYAARGGTTTTRHWGDDLQEICRHANLLDKAFRRKRWLAFDAAECDDGYAGPAPVGKFPPNAFGLHDMLGNVFEWVEDRWHPDYAGAPEDGSAWERGGDESKRVRRGGSWDKSRSGVRAAYRTSDSPTYRDRDTGFRVLRELP